MLSQKTFFMHQIFYGKIVHGLGKGKKFGFPTINIKLNDKYLHIDTGVYAASVTFDNQTYKGMLYVGTRPTLNMKEISIEIHIFDFNKEIYDAHISFQILHKMRDEVHFETIEKLIEQLYQDKEMVYKYFTC